MAEVLKLSLPISIQDVIKIWARQAGSFDKTVPPEIQEKKYMDALMELFHMFAKHYEEMDDSNFIRTFRFFRDTGFAKRLHADTGIAKRSAKLETLEPDMIPKEPEVIKPIPGYTGIQGLNENKKQDTGSTGIQNSSDSTSEMKAL